MFYRRFKSVFCSTIFFLKLCDKVNTCINCYKIKMKNHLMSNFYVESCLRYILNTQIAVKVKSINMIYITSSQFMYKEIVLEHVFDIIFMYSNKILMRFN